MSTVDLEELIRDARKELRRAEGVPLSPAELDEDLHKPELAELEKFMMRSLGVGPLIMLLGEATWTSKGAAMVLRTEGLEFHLRKAQDGKDYLLFHVEGDGEREIARIEASDKLFSSKVLVSIGDVLPSAQ